jgi:hypothetical protein
VQKQNHNVKFFLGILQLKLRNLEKNQNQYGGGVGTVAVV